MASTLAPNKLLFDDLQLVEAVGWCLFVLLRRLRDAVWCYNNHERAVLSAMQAMFYGCLHVCCYVVACASASSCISASCI